LDEESGEYFVIVTAPGSKSSKGNVNMVVAPTQIDDLMAELRLQATERRPLTPAEMVRRTVSWVNTAKDGEEESMALRFKVGGESGSRTITIPKDSVLGFIARLQVKLEAGADYIETIIEMNAAEAAKSEEDDSLPQLP